MKITDLPKDIQDALNALAWSENGYLWGLRYNEERMYQHTHTLPIDMATRQGIIERWPTGDMMLRHDGARIDPIRAMIPPIGTPVVQIQRAKNIVRTSVVNGVSQTKWPVISLVPGGPAAGIPIAGDSGSICFWRDSYGNVMVLGIVEYSGTCCYPYPDARIDTFNAPVTFDHLLGKTGDTEIVTPPVSAPDLDDLRLANAKLAMDNADLRAAVQSEQAKSAALQAKIDSFRSAINSIIQ